LRLQQHPASDGRAQENRDHSFGRLLRPAVVSLRPPGSGRTDRSFRMGSDRGRRWLHHGALDDDAGGPVPSRGDEDLRARATDDLRVRPPRRRTHSWNHRLSAELGWFFCTHNRCPLMRRHRWDRISTEQLGAGSGSELEIVDPSSSSRSGDLGTLSRGPRGLRFGDQ
jgi:hypothetical protein